MLDEEDEEEEEENEKNVEEQVQPPSVNFRKKSKVVKNALTAIRKSKDTETPLESLQTPEDNDDNEDVFEMRQADQNAPDYSEDNQQSIV